MPGFFSNLFGGAAPADDLAAFFTADHQACDAAWAEVEAAPDLATAAPLLQAFDRRMRRHLAMEEEVLFPAFDAASGMAGMGPPAVMRAEHAQMRAVLDQMVGASDLRALHNLGDTLLMLIQQHNLKEEGMLYPMCAQLLDWASLRASLAKYGA